MNPDDFSSWVISCMLVTLRIAPLFAFAPPFTLIRVPATVRLLLSLGLAICIVGGGASDVFYAAQGRAALAGSMLRELFVDMSLVMMFQVAFAGLQVAGRTLDIQAGFGLAMLIDPTTRAQTPLSGTLFAYAAGVVFFAMNGHHDVLRFYAASIEAVPLGLAGLPANLAHLTGFLAASFLIAFGVAGGAILTLFMADLAIALLSRTVPQMNALMIGFQVKTLLLLLVLALSFGGSAALIARLMALTLSALPGIRAHG